MFQFILLLKELYHKVGENLKKDYYTLMLA